jgi:hypothetical protein
VGRLEHVDAGDPVAHEEPGDEWWVDRPEVAEEPVAEDDVVEGGAGSGERGNVDSTVEAEEYVSGRMLSWRMGCTAGPWAAARIDGSEDLVAGGNGLTTRFVIRFGFLLKML